MGRPRGPNATVAWLRANDDLEHVAGAAFMVAPELAVTCTHVIREHLGLNGITPREPPQAKVRLRFEWLAREVAAKVAPDGWWPDGVNTDLEDVAVLCLEEPMVELDCAGLALSPHRPMENCYIYGAPSGYQGYGQTVYAQLAGQPHSRGWYQLNARPGEESGYFVKRGFSGSAVFDEMGNTIWGMVVAVETEPNKLVAFAISASDLRRATRKAMDAMRREGAAVSEAKIRRIEPALGDAANDTVTALIAQLRQLAAEQPSRREQILAQLAS